jgi:hypothetical protein
MNCARCGIPAYSNAYSGTASLKGSEPCAPHLTVVTRNFVAPAADVPVAVQVADSSALYVGQGIKLGNGFYQITDIVSAVGIVIQHAGLGITTGTLVVASHPVSGCYQYPIRPVGEVSLNYDPSVYGFDADYSTIVDNAYSGVKKQARYSWAGPSKVVLDLAYEGELLASARFIGIQLPIPRASTFKFTGNAQIQFNNGKLEPAVVLYGAGIYGDYLMIGKTGEGVLASGTGANVYVGGSYEILV